jgi:menaquinol-cytochrome c reductase cytochrome b/c subunit
MADIPESLLRRSAEAKAKALGVPVEQVLAEMRGEAPPTPPPSAPEPAMEPAPEVPASAEVPEEAEAEVEEAEVEAEADEVEESAPSAPEPEPESEPATQESPAAVATEPVAAAVATATEEPPTAAPEGNGSNGNGSRRAAVVSARPVAPPANVPEGVRTQRLLTVVKARAIQNVKAEPQDKVNTWPHLMIAEFTALMAMTAFLLILSVILQAPLLEPANFNATPNPSKAPWYFLGLQELLSYFDPQIAGVTVPTIVGLVGFMMIPYVDKNPSNKPSDRKFAIMLYTIFLTGSAVLTIIGVLFRGQGFNFAYPWRDGVFFDDLKDWVHFE